MLAALFCCVLLLIIFWNIYYNRDVTSPPMAAGGLPVVGHAWWGFVKRERTYEILLKHVLGPSLQRDEEVVYVRIGMWKLYVCMDPEDVCLVLNTCLKKDPIYSFFDPAFDNGLFNSDGPTWKRHRKLLNPTFNRCVLDSYLAEFNEQSRQLKRLLTQEVGKGHFDQLPYLKQTILQIVCATMMGVNLNENPDIVTEYGKAVDTFSNCMIERVRKFYYHSDFIYNLSTLKRKQFAVAKISHQLVTKFINNKNQKMNEQKNNGTDTFAPRIKSFLDLLLEMNENGNLTESEIRQEVNAFIVAGYDTTYHALGMTLLVIGSYPEIQKKILKEIQAVAGNSTSKLEKQDLSKLKYLEAVIKETLRLYPVLPFVGRVVENDLKLKKYILPVGSRCFLSIYHVGRHRSWGVDAEQFRPERWLDGSLPQNSGAYAVFGLGRRSCIGSNYAMMLMKTVLCHVVRRYRISGDVTRLVQNFEIVTTPASGHHISIELRR